MTLISGIQPGLISELQTGLNPGGYSLATVTPADIAAITGKPSPTLMYRGNDATGATELVAGTDNLTDVGTVKLVADAALGVDTTEFNSALDAMVAAASGVADVGAETITIVLIKRMVTKPTGSQSLVSKRDPSSPNNGFELSSFQGQIQWACDSSSGTIINAISVDHGEVNPQTILATREFGTDRQAVFSREGTASSTRYAETLSNAANFAIGRQRLGTAFFDFALCCIWIGTDGDGYGETERLAIAQAMGLE